MIYATGRKRTRCRANGGTSAPGTHATRKPLPSCGGFTLIELALALALIGLLMGALVVNYASWQTSGNLEEAGGRMESALRMARAEAANSGRRLRIAFTEEGDAQVLWEPDPLTQPGRFVPYAAGAWASQVAVPGVQVASCIYVGDSAYRNVEDATAAGSAQTDSLLPPVTFEPDGSSDSVVIELADLADPETRRVRVELDGLTGRATSRVLTLEDMEAY